MTVATLRAAIAARAAELLPEALVSAEQKLHKNHLWRDCPCSYCETKRKASFEIGTPPMGHSRSWREQYREQMRTYYRARLASEAGRIDACPTTSPEAITPTPRIHFRPTPESC